MLLSVSFLTQNVTHEVSVLISYQREIFCFYSPYLEETKAKSNLSESSIAIKLCGNIYFFTFSLCPALTRGDPWEHSCNWDWSITTRYGYGFIAMLLPESWALKSSQGRKFIELKSINIHWVMSMCKTELWTHQRVNVIHVLKQLTVSRKTLMSS